MMNMNRLPPRRLLQILTGLLVVLILLLALIRPKPAPLPDSIEAAVAVTTLTVHPTNLCDMVSLPALVEAHVDALLSAEMAGRIVRLEADRGDPVERNQLLLQIDDRIWQANLRQAGIAESEAKKNLDRFRQLKSSGAVADSEFDAVEKAFVQAQSRAEEARINIEQCRVLSPITGIVNDRFVDEGEYVQPGAPVFQVVDAATVNIVLQMPEKDIYSVESGDVLYFSVQPLPERLFEGQVTFIAPQADARNNAFRTELTADNADGALRPGMIAQVEFRRREERNRISLPMAAVLPSKGDHIVFLARDGRAVRRKVQIDSITRKQALIAQGLNDGDQVILEGNRLLSDGQRVDIQNTEAAQ